MRQNLARYLSQAGEIDRADQVYRQLVQDYSDGGEKTWMMTMYAQYLSETKRTAQGESLLQDFLAGHSELDAPQKMSVLYSLSNLARSTGDSKRGDEYQRAAEALQPPQPPTGRILIGDEIRARLARRSQQLIICDSRPTMER